MNKAIAHRGPDDSGVWSDEKKGIYLGHQRLSILDLSLRGHQPMGSAKGTMIVFNGEIYNFRELAQSHNYHDLLSASDTEVLLRLYDDLGKYCLQRANGMFAVAIWDDRQERLFLARDRIGIKPLYYTTLGGVFSFSSEIKSLLTLPWVSRTLDEDALYDFLTFNKTFPPQTMFKGISKFNPGYQMVVGTKGIESYDPYWEVGFMNPPRNDAELEYTVLEELRRSVRYRMISDVPVGAFLSGGVDSSAIVALMSEKSPCPVKTYSIGFEGETDFDELQYAKQVSVKFKTEHYEKIVTKDEIVEFLPKIVEIFDEPLADATSIPIFFISKLARETGSKVVLTGDGADELFCGYRSWVRYLRYYPYFRACRKIPGFLKPILFKVTGFLPAHSLSYEFVLRALKGQEFFWGGAGGLKESVKASILSDSFRNRMSGKDSYSQIKQLRDEFEKTVPTEREMHYVDWMCFSGIKNIIPNYYLYRSDKLGMANSIELRVPFLDHAMVELALSIPGGYKVEGAEPKNVLKKSLQSILPREVLYRKKQGFCVPISKWISCILKDNVETKIKKFSEQTGLFNEEAIQTLILQSRNNAASIAPTIWNIYFLLTWYEHWVGRDL